MAVFISIEGTDGAGKTTLIEGLKRIFKDESVLFTREPGGTKLGEKIREMLLAQNDLRIDGVSEVYLFAAARRQHVNEVILPNLKENVTVVSDRFLDSSIAYQGAGRKLGEDLVKDINKGAVNGVEPDLTIFLDISPEVGIERIHQGRINEINQLDNESLDFYYRVKSSYAKIIEDNPDRFFIVDAEQSEEKVLKDVVSKFRELMR
ncbi:dTMP kinase [Weissella confusa]|uniref:dTMP kinase n=1 Tax=Weissella confusa TaxID=1583 RepID=UPI0018F26038|nr:dTMP kinase [Weissella confusa]